MATALTAGYIYLIESDAADNQNWLHDPENIDLDNFTEGTEFCKLQIPLSFKKDFSTGVDVTDAGAYKSYDMRSEKRGYQFTFRATASGRTSADLIEYFLMIDRHTSGSSTVFHRYYLIFKYGTNDYEKFIDNAGAQQEYCKGIVIRGTREWDQARNLQYGFSISWRSVW